MVNHGDPKSPGAIPIPNGLLMFFFHGGDPNYLLIGMILQVKAGRCSRAAQSFFLFSFIL